MTARAVLLTTPVPEPDLECETCHTEIGPTAEDKWTPYLAVHLDYPDEFPTAICMHCAYWIALTGPAIATTIGS